MSFVFTSQEITQITLLRDQAPAKGNYADAYNYIADTINSRSDLNPLSSGYDKGTDQVYLWLRGASQANSGQGIFSTFIREYTQRQGEVRICSITLLATSLEAACIAGSENLTP